MKKFAKAFYLVLILIFLYLPIGTLMVLSFNDGKSMNAWQGFSLEDFSVSFFIVWVIAYMFKDRIKSQLQLYFLQVMNYQLLE